jgi:pSer/pThr/pTyr-binding forkhead associated (FHA) protein
MEPKLFVTAGQLKGTTVPLTDSETIIGRDPANTVVINDPLVSRRHCSIRSSGNDIKLSDLESLNGTFVNGLPTREKALQHGDRIKVGASQFLFLTHDEAAEPGVPLSDSFDGQLITTVTVKLDRKDLAQFESSAMGESATGAGLARDLAAVLRISTAINALKEPEELQRRVIGMIFEVMPVERGAVLLVGHNSDEFISGIYRERESDLTEPFRISRTIARQVLHDGVAVLANDVCLVRNWV